MSPLTKITRALIVIATLAAAVVAMSQDDWTSRERSSPQGAALKGFHRVEVRKVLDGDTVDVIAEGQSYRIRLSDIDAPEASHCVVRPQAECQLKGQPWAEQSTESLQELLRGRVVELRCSDFDARYGRSVCRITAGEVDVNLEQVRRGLAWFNAKYSGDNQVRKAETEARRRRIGLWSAPAPVEPWIWRQNCWKRGICG